MSKPKSIDSQRNSLIRSLAFRWLELNRTDVVTACKEAGAKKYPRSSKARSRVELTAELSKLK